MEGDEPTLKFSKINNFKIKPLINADRPIEAIGGGKLIPEPYSNIFIVGKKASGKTTILYNLLKNCVNKHTTVIIFSSTINRDKTWDDILKMLEKKKCMVEKFIDFKNEEDGEILKDMIEQLKQVNPMEDEKKITDKDGEPIEPDVKPPRVYFGFVDEIKEKEKEEKRKEKEKLKEVKAEKKKKLYPKYVFVMDDMGDQMRIPVVAQLLKTNRHFLSKVIVSTQSLTDLAPSSRKQTDFCLCSHSLSPDKLKNLYHDLDISNTFEEFEHIYKKATEKPYCFLWIDVKRNKFRINFDTSIEI